VRWFPAMVSNHVMDLIERYGGNPLALKIVSTPGSAIVFLFEYVFLSQIPSDVADDALIRLLDFLANTARFLNSLDPPQPAILLVP